MLHELYVLMLILKEKARTTILFFLLSGQLWGLTLKKNGVEVPIGRECDSHFPSSLPLLLGLHKPTSAFPGHFLLVEYGKRIRGKMIFGDRLLP